jgi:UPF0755 protein
MFQLVKIVLYVTIPFFVGWSTYQYLDELFFQPLEPNSERVEVIEIHPEDTSERICELLVERQIIKTKQSLCLHVMLRGRAKSFVAGEHEVSPSLLPTQLLDKLQSGERLLRSVVIERGSSIKEIDKALFDENLIEQFAFEKMARNADLLASAGIAGESFEGYLGAGQLDVYKPAEVQSIVWELRLRSESIWEPRYNEQLDYFRMSRHELLTIASLIQKVTSVPSERRMVSAVLHNRLKNGLKLESREALEYGIPEPELLTFAQMKAVAGPYNTFMNYGLPPGPITNPDKDAIEAALSPMNVEHIAYAKNASGKVVFISAETAGE